MRFTMRSRLSWSLAGLGIKFVGRDIGSTIRRWPDRLSLDSALVHFALKNPFYVDSWSVNAVGIEFADIDQIFNFDDRDLCGGRHHRIKIAGGLAVNKIAPFVALPCFNESEVCLDCTLHHVFAAIEFTRFFVFGYHGTDS